MYTRGSYLSNAIYLAVFWQGSIVKTGKFRALAIFREKSPNILAARPF
jgi:hypothetical protein